MFQTRFITKYTAPAPADMMVIAQGEAPDLRSAAESFTAHAQEISAAIAVSANATIAQLEPEVVFEVTPTEKGREFFQRFVPADNVSLSSRFIDVEATNNLITALYTSEERGRLIRGVSQYYEALKHWRNGYELLALSHLFMGVEAIKTAFWRHKARKERKNKETLAEEWGYNKGGTFTLPESLDAASREFLVFQGDKDTLRTAKKTSDDFEHGSMDLGQLKRPARECLVETARYLREAIINIIDIGPQFSESILSERFEKPRGPLGTDTYVFGELLGDPESAAPEGKSFPYLEWKYEIEDVNFDASSQKYSYRPNQTFTARLGPGTKLENLKIQIWDTSTFWPKRNE